MPNIFFHLSWQPKWLQLGPLYIPQNLHMSLYMYMKCVCQEYKLKILRGTVFVKSMIQSGISRGVDGGLNQKDYQYSHMFPGATQFLQIGGCKINLPNKKYTCTCYQFKKSTYFKNPVSWPVVFPFLIFFRLLNLKLSLIKTKFYDTLWNQGRHCTLKLAHVLK